jgi:hypothetical protein
MALLAATQTLASKTLTSPVLNTGVSGTAISTDTSLGTSSTLLSSQGAIKAYVDAQIDTEDTIAELNDTNIGSLAAGHILVYDNTASVWDNVALSGGDGLTATLGDGTLALALDLKSNGGAVIESNELAVDLGASSITGTLAVGDGGTGATTLNDLITLTTHTQGNYVATVTAGTGLTSNGATSGEGVTHSLSVDASQGQITTVGDLATGTIASGFGTINNGSNTITTTGLVTAGALTVNGTTTLNGALVLGDAAGDTLDITASATVSTDFKFADNVDIALGTNADILMRNRSTAAAANLEITDIILGTSVHPGVAANSLVVSNITADGDMMFATNRGGNTEAHMLFDASAGDTFLYARGVQAMKITGGGAIVVTPSITANGGVVGDLTGDVTGNADTATALATTRAIAVAGDVTGTANFNGSAAISITTTLATDAIVTANITNANVTLAKMAANSVDSDQYVDGSIDSDHLAADVITGAKIADDAIDSEHYADGSIDNAHIADDAIDSEHYAAGSIDTAHIADNQVTLAKMAGIARGKIIYGDASGDPAVLASGSANQVLTMTDGDDFDWADPANAGDITSIVAGTGLTGSSLTSGAATVNVIGGTGITANANDIATDASQGHVTTVGALNAGSITSGFTSIDVGAGAISTTGLVTAGSIATGGSILVDSTPANTVYSGTTGTFTAGEALSVGECVYLKASDTRMYKAVSAAGGTGLISSDIMCVAMAAAAIGAGSAGVFLLQGFITSTAFPTYTIGETLYLPEAEQSSLNVPEGAVVDSDGDFVQVLGWASAANTIFFNPDYTIIEHA